MASSIRLTGARAKIDVAKTALRWGAADRAIHAITRLRFMMPDAHPSRHNLVLLRDVPYRQARREHGRAHLLDVYVPQGAHSGPLPVVMYVHGGGFAMLSKDTHRVMAVAIARKGYLVFNINYRLGPRHTYPAPLEDATEALLWVKENAARFGGDPTRIVIAGESAGGNLVTALAVATCFERPEPFARRLFDAAVDLRGVVATYGFLDLGYTERYLAHPRLPRWTKTMLADAAKSYLGPDLRAACARAPLASPLCILEDARESDRPLPPFFVSVGTRDPLITCSRRLKAALDRRGVSCTLHISPREIHGYDAFVWRPAARAKWEAAHEFLTERCAVRSEAAE